MTLSLGVADDIILASPDNLTKEDLDRISRMQPKARVCVFLALHEIWWRLSNSIYLQLFLTCRLIDSNTIISKLKVPYEMLICRPIKAIAIYNKIKDYRNPKSLSPSTPTSPTEKGEDEENGETTTPPPQASNNVVKVNRYSTGHRPERKYC